MKFATTLISRVSLPVQQQACRDTKCTTGSGWKSVFSVLLTKTESELVSGGDTVRTQPGMMNATINKEDKDKDLNKLPESFSGVSSCQVISLTGVTTQTDSERPTPLYSTSLWSGSLALILRFLHVQVHY